MHTVVIINSGKDETKDINMRRTIIHGVDKAKIIKKEFDGIGEAVDRLFPRSAPYSDVELTPRYDYDLEKAKLLNCEVPGLKEEIGTLQKAVKEDPKVDQSASSVLALAACVIAFFF
jgi:hypothetical protein